MSNLLERINSRCLIVALVAMAMIAAIACGTEATGSAAAPADTAPVSAAADSTANSSASSEESPSTGPGGIDESCVQQLLGREVAGFNDITAAERDLIFQNCTGDPEDRPQRALGDGPGDFGGFRFGGELPECITNVIGDAEFDPTQITQEMQAAITESCGNQLGFRAGAGPDRAAPAEGGRFFGGGGFQLPECVTEALGGAEFTPGSLNPELQAAIAESCGGEFGLFAGPGGQGGAGGFSGGDFQRGGGQGNFGTP